MDWSDISLNIENDEELNPYLKQTNKKTLVKSQFSQSKNTNSFNKSFKSTKFKHQLEDDPLQFHANPDALSKHALLEPKKVVEFSNAIFTRTSFDSLQLNLKLVEIIQNDQNKGGFNLKTATRIQSVTIPLLNQRKNALIKSQTGSGKTLAFLLPIVNDLMNLTPQIQRSNGTFALIIAPTRELSQQITDVLSKLTQACIWIVGGSISGGEKRKSEKARLRKGIVIVVSTPGRLLDHLKTTEAFELRNLRWLVLDEADRLLDMGFEQALLEIFSILRGEALPGLKVPFSLTSSYLSKKCGNISDLTSIMASATLTENVQYLALPLMSNRSFIMVDADTERMNIVNSKEDIAKFSNQSTSTNKNGIITFFDEKNDDILGDSNNSNSSNSNRSSDNFELKNNSNSSNHSSSKSQLYDDERIDTPIQLAQYYMNVTCKWRLAALMSFLRAKVTNEKLKVIVFFSTCDSVDYHTLLLRESEWPTQMDNQDSLLIDNNIDGMNDEKNGDDVSQHSRSKSNSGNDDLKYLRKSKDFKQFIPNTKFQIQSIANTLQSVGSSIKGGMLGETVQVFRLHGNLAHSVRQQVYKEFCTSESCVLLCTDVAARGLDLPKVDWILQYDPPCDITDYVHRAGRTARKGLHGSALLFLLPSEAAFVPLLHSHNVKLEPLSLKSLFLSISQSIPGAMKFKNIDELSAVIIQRRLELVVEKNKLLVLAGQQAYQSYVRAYSSHSIDTKGIFKVQSLHLGHVAKSFALRINPNAMKNRQDIIGEICNGKYSIAPISNKTTEKVLRHEKYYSSKKPSNDNNKRKFENTDIDESTSQHFISNKKTPLSNTSSDTKSNKSDENLFKTTISSDPKSYQKLKKLGKNSTDLKHHMKSSIRKLTIRKINSEFDR